MVAPGAPETFFQFPKFPALSPRASHPTLLADARERVATPDGAGDFRAMASPLSTIPYALVVDDDALILSDAEAILQDAGFRTLTAMDSEDAMGQ